MNAHTRLEEMIAAYALDALAEEEAGEAGRELLDHLASCEQCQRLYRDLRETAADLALAAEPEPVGAALREEVLGVARETPRRPAASRGVGRVARAMLVASVAGVMALGGVSAYLAAQLGDARAERKQAQRVLAFINQPSTTVTTMQGSDGAGRMTLAVQPDGQALLIGSDLRLPRDRVFEIWLVRGPKVVPAGIFVTEDGSAVVDLRIDPERDLGVAITIERARVEQPTSEPVFQGAISA
jgi:hypothetical protein